jgi:hypothetical protein
MILSAKLQRNTSLAITSGSKSFELRVQLYGSPPHGKSSIKISTIVCKYDIYLISSIQKRHLLDQDGGCRSPELRLFSKKETP